jgi:hypothetical protein
MIEFPYQFDVPDNIVSQEASYQSGSLASTAGVTQENDIAPRGLPTSSQAMQFTPYYYHWVPCQENGNMGQLMPPQYMEGYVNQFGQSCVTPFGESPQFVWTREGTVGMQFGYQMADSSVYVMPQPHQQSVVTDQSQSLPYQHHSGVEGKMLDQLTDKLQKAGHKGSKRNSKDYFHLQSGGLRTPSSIGTPPATGTPSESPTPHSSSPRVQNASASDTASSHERCSSTIADGSMPSFNSITLP